MWIRPTRCGRGKENALRVIPIITSHTFKRRHTKTDNSINNNNCRTIYLIIRKSRYHAEVVRKLTCNNYTIQNQDDGDVKSCDDAPKQNFPRPSTTTNYN